MEPFRQSTRPRAAWPARKTFCASDGSRAGSRETRSRATANLTRKGQAALDLVSQVADTISATENRIETLLVRALEQLKTMEDRNRALEGARGRRPRRARAKPRNG